MFDALGLDELTSRVYLTMITHQGQPVRALAGRAGLAEDAVRSALDVLARKSLLRAADGDREGFVPVNPSVGLAALLAEQEREVDEQRVRLARTRQEVARLASEWAAGQEECGSVERVRGAAAVASRVGELAQGVRSDVVSFVPCGGGGAWAADGAAATGRAAAAATATATATGGAGATDGTRAADGPGPAGRTGRAGVRVRTVFLDRARRDRPLGEDVRALLTAGADVRSVPALPLGMSVFDGSTAVVPFDPDDPGQGVVVLTSRGVVTALCALFEAVWQSARPWQADAPEAPSDRATAQDRELLRFLRAGLTDEAMSRQLGVSVRTTRRLLARLMARLGARCRFEAGYEAARRGWL
ncbi:helix-turn-helix transcriptional regulator [Streptomyces sp. STR69]|uniref:helix-turn-helix transcriptional regulator n=1 Tax=Streptomyces sp. STR69 TaxID=1796942 RepID=UPI0021CA0B1D|nr:LuxR family transcriptional regulator [Streptomyces sp. STR69]